MAISRKTYRFGTKTLPRLQQRIILNRFFCRLFGFDDFKGLREQLRNVQPGYAEDGHSYFYHTLLGLQGLQIPPDQLAAYDLRIKGYVERLNRARTPPIQLLYFQYLAVLFTEIYLKRLFDDQNRFLIDLNVFARGENGKLSPATPRYPDFTEDDLTKIAFWMATGSGKTLIMHVNLWQYLRYSAGKVQHDNVLLITPNEGLSKQHLDEFRKSGIAANHYGEAGGTPATYGDAPVTMSGVRRSRGSVSPLQPGAAVVGLRGPQRHGRQIQTGQSQPDGRGADRRFL